MRTIIFRGKRINGEEGWIYGDLNQFHHAFYISDQNKKQVELTQVIPKTVGQFTGFDDLYEGDILKVEGIRQPYIGVIGFEAGSFIVTQVGFENNDNPELLYDWIQDGPVKIGNKFDNPELLK